MEVELGHKKVQEFINQQEETCLTYERYYVSKLGQLKIIEEELQKKEGSRYIYIDEMDRRTHYMLEQLMEKPNLYIITSNLPELRLKNNARQIKLEEIE